jgi:Ca-activated chloride channel family protein
MAGRAGRAGARAGLVLALCLPAGAAFHAQQAAPDSPLFRAGVVTVPVTVTVTDAAGRLVTGLTIDDFEIYENGVAQPVTLFTDERVPVSLGVLLDTSDSMRGEPIVDARTAVDQFLVGLLEPGDEAFVAFFNHEASLAATWTRPPANLPPLLAPIQPFGGTSIYDAIIDTAPLFRGRAHQRAALVVISDGADTASFGSIADVRDVTRCIEAFFYAIGIDNPDGRRLSTRVNPAALNDITGPSGGYTEIIASAGELGPATQRIADELNSQYTLAYTPAAPPDGEWRTILVRTKDRALFTRARRGYYAVPDRPAFTLPE